MEIDELIANLQSHKQLKRFAVVYPRQYVDSAGLEDPYVTAMTGDVEYETGVGRCPEESEHDISYCQAIWQLEEDLPELEEICVFSEFSRMYRGTRQSEGHMHVWVEEDEDRGTTRFPVRLQL